MRMSGALIFMLPNYVIEAFNLLTDKICLEYGDEVYQMMECFEDNHIGRFKEKPHTRHWHFPSKKAICLTENIRRRQGKTITVG